MSKSKKVRINIDVYPEKLDEIKRMMEIAGVPTQRELLDNALTLTKWMMRQKKAGKSIGAFIEDRFIELEMPFLDHAKNTTVVI